MGYTTTKDKDETLWKDENMDLLEMSYKEYLSNCSQDNGFNLGTVEPFEEWIDSEWEWVKEKEEEQ